MPSTAGPVPSAAPHDLTAAAHAALTNARARRFSYDVRVLRAPDGRPVVILGEAHVKLARAAGLGRAVVAAFDLRGVEWFQRERVAWGTALMVVVAAPRRLLRWLSLGTVRDSTIVDAKELTTGTTYELEAEAPTPLSLHVGSIYLTLFFLFLPLAAVAMLLPRELDWLRDLLRGTSLVVQLHLLLLPVAILFRRRPWSWLVHPLIAILVARDAIMAEGTARMLARHPGPPSAVLVMGRAHGPGVETRLVERHGFRREEL
jgi:hypothetical protein